jgi:nucleotide-binding universal stress UspA family protein
MLNTDARRAISADQSKHEHLIPMAALMVHVDMDHDSEKTVELAIALAERFQAALTALPVARCGPHSWPEMPG